MATTTTALQITVTFAGQTRTLECEGIGGQPNRAFGPYVLYGVFPTGSKAHRTEATFWAVDSLTRPPAPGAVSGTDQDGREWLLDQRLYTHNRNHGQIIGWADTVDPRYVARW